MARQAPTSVDVLDFQFKLHSRLKIFTNEDNSVFNKPCNLLAVANRFGLIFVGTASAAFQVIRSSDIEGHSLQQGEIINYKRRSISLPSSPKHLSVNCDCTKLAVVVEQNGCPIAIIYDIASFTTQEVYIIIELRLSPTPGVYVIETSWNPSIPDIFTACKSDGTLGLYELKNGVVDINELPTDSQATCMCWSPKGKQIAVGSRDGKITQYKPDLKAMKVVNPPPLEGSHSLISLQWISNYQFIGVFKPQNLDGAANLIVIDAPKTGGAIYTNYEDICYSDGNVRSVQFYMIHQQIWNILMVASSNSMEVGVMGNVNEQWIQWTLGDSARAELPLSPSKQETLPIGLEFNTSSIEPVLWGETSLPPAPFLLLFSHYGLLCCFKAINVKYTGKTVCQEPERLNDVSGLHLFIEGSSEVVVQKQPEPLKEISIPPPNSITVPIPVKPTAVTLQGTFSFSPSSITTTTSDLFTNTSTTFFGSPSSFVPPRTSAPLPQQIPPIDTKPSQSSFFNPPAPAVSVITKPLAKAPVPTAQPAMPAASVPITFSTPSLNINESNVAQEEADNLLAKLIREEYEALEAESKALLHKGRNIKIDLESNKGTVDFVEEAALLEDFLKEVVETSTSQAAEVHSLKQGLIQTWAWYEDARFRFAFTHDAKFGILIRIQQLDPICQKYSASIKHMIHYLESQLIQASQVLDEQWECFQDSCRKIVRLKIPTMEAIFQTMVRETAILQKQKYILKDISSRIRAQRSKLNGPPLLVSLKNVDQLEKELQRLQLEPEHPLNAQYRQVYETQKKLTETKVRKLTSRLLNRKITEVSVNESQISKIDLESMIKSSPAVNTQALIKGVSESATLLGAGLSPISSSKFVASRVVDFNQSTPKSNIEQKQSTMIKSESAINTILSETDLLKKLPPGISIKPSFGTAAPKLFEQSTATVIKPITTVTTAPIQFKFTTTPTTSLFTSVIPTSSITSPPITATTDVNQLNFNFTQTKTSTATPQSLFANLQMKSPTENSQRTFTPLIEGVPVAQVPQFKVDSTGDVPQSETSFGSFFNLNKSSVPAFSFSSTVIPAVTTAATTVTKTLASTTSSAFVPTTQLTFNFSTKNTAAPAITTLTPTSSAFAQTKSSTFNFGNTAFTFTSGNAAATTTTKSDLTPTTAIITSIAKSNTPPIAFSAPKSITSTTTTQNQPFFKAVSVAETTTASTINLVIPKPITTTLSTIATSLNQATTTSTAATSASIQIPQFSFTKAMSTASSVPSTNIHSPTSASITKATTENVSQPNTFAASLNSPFKTSGVTTPSSTSLFGTTTIGSTTSGFTFGASTLTSPIFGAPTTGANLILNTSSTTVTNTPIFGSPTTTTVTSSIFGAPPSTIATATSIPATPTISSTTVPVSIPATATATTTAAPTVSAPTAAPIFGVSTTTAPAATSSTITTTTTTGVTSIFGAAVTTTTSKSVFGIITTSSVAPSSPAISTTTSTVFAASPSIPFFGGAATTATSPSIFSSPTTTTPATPFGLSPPSTSVFNAPDVATTVTITTASSSIFGAAPTNSTSIFGAPTSTPSVFGQSTSTTSSIFGGAPVSGSVFANVAKTTSNTAFGSVFSSTANNTNAFSNSTFGNTTTSNSVFGQSAAFGSGSLFGSPVSSSANTFGNTSFTAGGSVFGAQTTAPSGFGQTTSPSSFSFATAAAKVPFGFDSTPTGSDGGSFSFGNLSMSNTDKANTGFGSGFGQQPSNANPFAKATAQEQTPAFGGSLFGTPATTSSSVFGGGSPSTFGNQTFGSQSGFGSSPGFGQQSTFGQSSFGNSFSSPQPGPFSGGNQSVAQTGFGSFNQTQQSAFGSAPVFGGSPSGFGAPPSFGSSAFGGTPSFGNPPKVFGDSNPTGGTFGTSAPQQNSTFANLAGQNTLGFGSLAAGQQPVSSSQQPMSGFSSGGSSFSTWR